MYLFALEKGITLTDQELAACKEAAEAYYASLSDAEKEYIGADVEVIEAAYVHYTYANDLYNTMTEGGVFEISDDAARVMDAYVIRTSEESNAKMAYADLQDGEEFLAVASIYAEQSTITTSISRSSYNDTLVSAAFALEEGAYTEVLAGEDGYYIIYCVSKYNEDLTEENRALLVRLRRKRHLMNPMRNLRRDCIGSSIPSSGTAWCRRFPGRSPRPISLRSTINIFKGFKATFLSNRMA